MDAEIIQGDEVWVFFKVDVLDAALAATLGVFPLTANDSYEIVDGLPGRTFISAEEDSVLAKLWDNDADKVFEAL